VVGEFGGGVLGRFFGDVFEGAFADEAEVFEELGGVGVDLGGRGAGGEAGAPEDFVGHPVADAGKGCLIEEEGLDGELGVAWEDVSEAGGSEGGLVGLRREIVPGALGIFLVEEDAAELAVVVKDERLVVLIEHEVVVLGGLVIGGAALETAGHPQM
jgi:hypothetical protein